MKKENKVKMSTEDDASTKAIPQFKGTDEGYANWLVKFFAHSRVKGFHEVIMGTKAVPATAKANKTAEEKKLERCNNVSYSHLIMSVDGKAFPMVKNARTAELPAGSLSLAWNKLKEAYEPVTKQALISLTEEFHACALKNVKEDPELWFNMLTDMQFRLVARATTSAKKL